MSKDLMTGTIIITTNTMRNLKIMTRDTRVMLSIPIMLMVPAETAIGKRSYRDPFPTLLYQTNYLSQIRQRTIWKIKRFTTNCIFTWLFLRTPSTNYVLNVKFCIYRVKNVTNKPRRIKLNPSTLHLYNFANFRSFVHTHKGNTNLKSNNYRKF